MALSNDIISQFVKITNDKTEEKKETIVYGTVVVSNSTKYVKIDGSDLLTPIMATADATDGDRVTVMIKNHTATITGNVSSPAARSADVKGMGSDYQKLSNKIDQFEILVADKVDTEALNAVTGRIDYLVSDNTIIRQNLTAAQADITNLQSDNVTINNRLTAAEADITELKADKLDVNVAKITYATIDNLKATNADVHNLESTYANFVSTTTAKLTAQDASISDLQAKKLSADTANITYAKIDDLTAATADITDLEATFSDFETTTTNKLAAQDASIANLQADKVSASAIEGKYANIDFSNVGKAAMQYFYAESGLIQDVVVGDTTITGKLVGVTISGDLIEGNTVKAEKLVIKGTDGLYYKLNTDGVTTEAEQTNQNSLDGSVIKAKSITATKITVDDLVAFGATIGGFHITNSAIYSGVKESVDNATSGLYMDKEGQLALGDSSEYLKYYKDQNGDYHLAISAQSVLMATSSTPEDPQSQTIEDAIDELSEATTTNANDLANYITSTNSELENLQNQIDGSITTWFYEYEPTASNVPAKDWTTTDAKNTHLGDLFYNTLTGYCYRWQVLNNIYSWNRITDVDVTKALADAAAAQDTADKKRRVFVTIPTTPYDVGDLWAQGTSGELMRCKVAKTANQSYAAADWEKASKYTDDTVANNAKKAADAAQTDINAVKTRVSSAETQIAQNKESIALRATKTEVTESLSGYYTKEQADAALTVKANEISSNVSSTYATKTALDTTNSNVTAVQSTATQAKNAVDGLEIGGRNYILKSDKWESNGSASTGITQTIENGVKKIISTANNGNWNSFVRNNVVEDNFKDGDQFTFAVEIKSEDSTVPPTIYFKSGLGYYPMKGTVSSNYSWCYYTGTWKDTNDISFHFGWKSAIGTYYLRRLLFVKGNKLLDWSPAPEDVTAGIAAAQATADSAQSDVNALVTRVVSAETSISQHTDAINLRATKNEVSTAKSEAISTAASDATTKANNAKSAAISTAASDATTKANTAKSEAISTAASDATTKANNAKSAAISTAASDATTKANNALTSAKSYTDAQLKVASDSITAKVTEAKTTADYAKNGIDNLKIGGRNILLNSKLTDNADNWEGVANIKEYITKYNRRCAHFKHTALKQTKYISQSVLNKLEPNTTYTMSGWVLSENIVKGTTNHTCMFYHSGSYTKDGTSTWFGYGSKGIPINTGTGTWTRLVWTFTTDDKLKTATNCSIQVHTRDLTGDIYFCDLKLEKGNRATDWTPAPEDAESGISALDTRMTSAEASLTVLSNSVSSNVTETTNLGTRMSTVEQKAGALTVRLDNAESSITTAQSTANTAKTNAATAQSTANTALARTTVKDTREDNQTPSWYMTNYPKQTVVEFKKCTAIGLSGSTYCSLETIVPWNDKSGSYPKQTATVNEKQYWRTGTSDTAWGSWMAASETATNFISFDTTNGVLIGNKTSGSWSGTRAQITGSALNILDSSGTVLSSYGTTTTIGKTTGNNIYIDSDSIDIRKNGKVLATFDQYGLKIANTNDATGSLGSGTTKPALVIGTQTGYHIEMDNNEIMAKSNATTSSHLFLNMEGGNVSVNNNADRAFMFQEGALYAKNASYNSGNYLGIIDALNDAGNTVFGYGGYINKIGSTNIYGNGISLVSNGNIDVEASWINCRSIAPNDNATYALGIYGEKGWSNIYLGKGDNKTNALHIISGSSTYLLCGVNSSGQYVFGNNAAIMYYQAKDVGTTNTGNAFKITSGNNAAANNTNSVWLFGAADATSRYIGSYMAYSRTYSSAANMVVTGNGVFGRSTSSSLRYKNSIVEADISELKGLYDLPVKKFKYNTDYISSDDELYDKYLYGFIVEDLENVLPCAVEHITDEAGNAIPEMWNSNVIVPSLLKLIQDLNNRLAALEKKGE